MPPGMMPPGMMGGYDPYGGQQQVEPARPSRAAPRPYLEPHGGIDQAEMEFGRRGSWGWSPVPTGGIDVSLELVLNGFALTVLTTPVAYMGTLPRDSFLYRGAIPFKVGYFSYSPYDQDPDWNLPAAGTGPHYLLCIVGPDNTVDVADPYVGPFVQYDPTNGTVSSGDLLYFDGVLRP